MRNLKLYLDAVNEADQNLQGIAAQIDELMAVNKTSEAMALKPELDAAKEKYKAANSIYAAMRDVNSPEPSTQEPGSRAVSVEDKDLAVGMSGKEIQNYSLLRLINAAIEAKSNPGALDNAGLEIEASEAMAQKLGRRPQGFFVPWDIQIAPSNFRGQGLRARNDQTVGEPKYGGYLVEKQLMSGSFIDILRNKMVTRQAGAQVLTGLVGDIDIPKKSATANMYWVGEGSSPTKGQMEFGQVAAKPKTAAGYLVLTRKMLKQSSLDVEMLAREDLAASIAVGIDLAGLHGLGAANQPLGLQYLTGIGSVAGGQDGLAPAWSHIVSLETEVSVDNADAGSLAYITNTKVRGKLKQITKANNQNGFVWENNEMNGYPAYATNQVSSTLTKGNQSLSSAIFFGNWADMIYPMWAGLDVLVDPYTNSTNGSVIVTAMQDVDVVFRRAVSFAAMLDALTA